MKKTIVACSIVAILIFLFSCDSSLEITKISIAKYPDKIAYVIGRDTSLDISGCEIQVTTKGGPGSIQSMDDEFERSYYDIIETIDFNKEGVYEVVLSRGSSLTCSFAIEVIKAD